MNKIIIYTLLIILVLILMINNVMIIERWYSDSNKTKDEIKRISSILNENNLDELKTINSDVVGIIKVANTNINYPVVQTSNNDYYMYHSLDKSINHAGWIFLDSRNNLNNLSKNNIIYGHARYDGTMFGTLKIVLNKKWYKNKDNHIISIIIKDKILSFTIFSAYIIKKEEYYLKMDFNSGNEYKEFITTIKNRSIYNFNTSISTKDKILTLSTCYDLSKRLVIHAKLVIEK